MAGAPPHMPPAANITSDEETGLGKWTEEEFVEAITQGRRPDGSALDPAMPWIYNQEMTELELGAPGPGGGRTMYALRGEQDEPDQPEDHGTHSVWNAYVMGILCVRNEPRVFCQRRRQPEALGPPAASQDPAGNGQGPRRFCRSSSGCH